VKITRYKDAKPYEAPKHFDMRGLRLQGFSEDGPSFAWTGMSHFLPGGGTEMDAGPLEKIYVVITGEVTIELGDGSAHILKKHDSCFIPSGEVRAIRNDTNSVASMLVIMPYPAGA
jgi:quercetin dioxygenase-like cupin family protein